MKPVYDRLYSVISGYLESLTLKDILDGNLDRDILTESEIEALHG